MSDYKPHIQGRLAEDRVCEYLEQQGLRLEARNFRCQLGEIDLIMWDKNMLVFVEVRQRSSSKWGSVLETITRSKQQKIIRTATYCLQHKRLLNKVVSRFDVVSVDKANGLFKIQWIKNAFQTWGDK